MGIADPEDMFNSLLRRMGKMNGPLRVKQSLPRFFDEYFSSFGDGDNTDNTSRYTNEEVKSVPFFKICDQLDRMIAGWLIPST